MRPVKPVRNRVRGSAVVEVALVLILLLMVLFGCVDFGFVLFEYATLAHKARSAARYAAINPSNEAAIRNIVLYDGTSLPAGVSEGSPGMFGLTPSMVNVARFDAGQPEDRIQVALSGYQVVFVGPYLAGVFTGKPITLTVPVEPQ